MSDSIREAPAVEVTSRAREALLGFFAADGKARHVRIHVGRGWGGLSYHLSLEETADPKRDVVFESEGLSFVAEVRQRHLLAGLKVEVQESYGREGIVVYSTRFEPGGCWATPLAVDFPRPFADKANAMLLGKPPSGKRWPRGQKFTLSPSGAAAEVDYRAAVTSCRATGRAALDAALTAWATARGLALADGVVMTQLSGKRLGLSALIESLEPTGIVADEVRSAIGRLVAAGVVEPLPPPSRADERTL